MGTNTSVRLLPSGDDLDDEEPEDEDEELEEDEDEDGDEDEEVWQVRLT
jgi:hypothetical protein